MTVLDPTLRAATPGVAPPLRIGAHTVDTPVVLAPMAGITNAPFRQLCREYGAGLYVCEMITSRALVERHPKTMRMIRFDEREHPRSLQLYGVDPATMHEAVRMVAEEDLADHVDMNFGCPVPKVTRRGGGSALPYKRRLFGDIVGAAVRAAEPAGIPVTVKFRVGIDDEHVTHLDAGRIAADSGAAAVTLHGRTAAQRYSGTADWRAIARLVEHVPDIPVLGNGDIFRASDALRMMSETGCAGVVVGRGCMGRPWLFRDLQAAFAGEPVPEPPALGEITRVIRRHAELLAAEMGEDAGLRDLRKHVSQYLRGFPVGSELRRQFGLVSRLPELDDLLARLDPSTPFPPEAEGPRGRQGSASTVVLPEGWLDDPEDPSVPAGAEMDHNGG
ncbi:tRNA dihydrouridine synthase DusB [Salinifilum aidingensis]